MHISQFRLSLEVPDACTWLTLFGYVNVIRLRCCYELDIAPWVSVYTDVIRLSLTIMDPLILRTYYLPEKWP